jgi:hypothetical protein
VAGGGKIEVSGGKIFRRRVGEHKDSNRAVLGGFGTVVSQGFEGYMHQLETRIGRRIIEEDRAMRYG